MKICVLRFSVVLAIFYYSNRIASGQGNSFAEIEYCTLQRVILQIFRDAHFSGSALPYPHTPCYHNLTGDDCPAAEKLEEDVFEFVFNDLSSCSAIKFTGTVFNVDIRVPISNTSENYIVIPSSCDVSDVIEQSVMATYESDGPEPSKVNYSTNIGLPSIMARLTFSDGSPVLSRVSVGVGLAIEISISDDQNGFWSALAVTNLVAFGSNTDISITLIRDQCIANMLDKRLYDPTVIRNSVSFPFAAFRFLNDNFVTFEIFLRVCSNRKEKACVKSCVSSKKRNANPCLYPVTRGEEHSAMMETSTLQLKLDVKAESSNGRVQAQTLNSRDPSVFKLSSTLILVFVGVIVVISSVAVSYSIYKRS